MPSRAHILYLIEQLRQKFGTPVDYSPDSVTVVTGGTETGTIAGVLTQFDGVEYSVLEVASTPGFDIQFAFSGVEVFDRVAVSVHYDGAATHFPRIQLYDYVNTAWVTVHALNTCSDFQQHFKSVQDSTNFIDGDGNVLLRLHHSEAGNSAHDIHVDYVALLGVVESPANLHVQEQDPHSQYILKDGSRAMEGVFDAGGYRIGNGAEAVFDTDFVTFAQVSGAIGLEDYLLDEDDSSLRSEGGFSLLAEVTYG